MKAIERATQTSKDFDELKTCLKTTLMTGDCDLVSRFVEKDAQIESLSCRVSPFATKPWRDS